MFTTFKSKSKIILGNTQNGLISACTQIANLFTENQVNIQASLDGFLQDTSFRYLHRCKDRISKPTVFPRLILCKNINTSTFHEKNICKIILVSREVFSEAQSFMVDLHLLLYFTDNGYLTSIDKVIYIYKNYFDTISIHTFLSKCIDANYLTIEFCGGIKLFQKNPI